MSKKVDPNHQSRWRFIFTAYLGAAITLSLFGGHARASTASITAQLSTPLARGEDLDYMFNAWHDRWDMNEVTDLYQYVSTTCPPAIPAQYNPSTFANGIWSGTYQNDNPWVWLIYPGYNALHVGKDGNIHPIDATRYTQLTFRMYLGGDNILNLPGGSLLWTRDNLETLTTAGAAGWGLSRMFRIFPGWNIYTIDLTKIGIQQGSLDWGGLITGLRLDTGLRTTLSGITDVKLDWVRLTPKPTNQIVAWSGTWTGTNALLSVSSDGVSYDPLHSYTNHSVVTNIVDADAVPAGTGSGNTSISASFPPGDVYVDVQIGQSTSNTAGPWHFQAHPMLTITRPSFDSGDEFATSIVGNPWDMNGPADISAFDQIVPGWVFTGNTLIATSNSVSGPGTCGPPWGDPKLDLNMGGQHLDTKRFRYFTVNIKVDAPFDFGNGWVSRLYWWKTDGSWGGSNDMPLYTGWNQFHVDMWGNVNDNELPGNATWYTGTAPINRLRFDPFEIPVGTQFELGTVKVTANDRVTRGTPFSILYSLDKPQNAVVTVYYDTDRNRANGRTPAVKYIPTPLQGPYFAYLPAINISTSGVNTLVYQWNTSSVAPGEYYISIDVNDGYDSVTWYSDTSVIVQ